MPKDDEKPAPSLARQVLADNLKMLLSQDKSLLHADGTINILASAKRLKMDRMKVQRAVYAENGGSMETLQKFADMLGKQPWELLSPGMRAPIPNLSPKAADLARLYDACEDKRDRERAYATARFLLTGQNPDVSAPPGEESEPPQPAAKPTATPSRVR